MHAVSEFMDRLGTRRALISLFLIVLFFGAFTAKDTFTSSTPKAQAGTCFTVDEQWKLRSGDVPLNVGNAHFGATVCMDENWNIDSVRPFLEGGVEGAGTPAGFQFINLGSWVESQNDTHVVVKARSQVKLCLPGFKSVVCSLTDTQTYTLRYTPVYGPYLPGTEPGVFTTSRTTYLFGGTSEGITFVRQ